MTGAGLSYDELDEILRGNGCKDTDGLSAIDGLIAAVVADPVTIDKTRWLPPIFGDRMPTPAAGSLEERVVHTVLKRHDEVELLLHGAPGDYCPIFMHHKGHLYVEDWAIGFARCVGLSAEAWMPIVIARPRPMIAPIMAVNDMLAKMLIGVGAEERRKLRARASRDIAPAILRLHSIIRPSRA